ncbi:AAA family ATPase, partial [Haloferax sp. KTX1]|uniref:AAA family ATPase n=1 Tax=Haloferax sp. KTX1 TaxID=2600597 RepID=UPI0011DE24D9
TDPDREGVKFEVRRGNLKAYNLSEGECSLLAFCYFVASLEGTESQGKDLIIYIDDPVSSLDSDHIFFVYSLIHGLITNPTIDQNGSKKDRYKQLFISTHNLDFLKFAKRLPKPGHGGKGHFIIERSGCGSIIKPMPHYLRQYVTEFHYLF